MRAPDPYVTRNKNHRYRKVALKVWGDESFTGLSPLQPSGQGLWLYLLTCPLTDPIPGVYRAGRASLAENLGWEIEEFDRCYDELASRQMVKADWKSKLLWLPTAIKYNLPESPSVVIYWSKAWAEIPECDLKSEVFSSLKTHICAIGKGFSASFQENFTEPTPPNNDGANQAGHQSGPQGVRQGVRQAGHQSGPQAGHQSGPQGVSHSGKPHKHGANQAGRQPGPQGVSQGGRHQEQEQEQEQTKRAKGGAGGSASGAPADTSPSAPPHSSFDSGSQLQKPSAPAGGQQDETRNEAQGELDGFDWRGPEVIDEVRDAVAEAQAEAQGKTGTRLPVNYTVPEAWMTHAKKTRPELPDSQLRDAAATFVGYWSSKPGKEGLKLNWLSTWLNWVRRERAPAAGTQSAQNGQPRLQAPSRLDDPERRRQAHAIAAKYGATLVGVPKD